MQNGYFRIDQDNLICGIHMLSYECP